MDQNTRHRTHLIALMAFMSGVLVFFGITHVKSIQPLFAASLSTDKYRDEDHIDDNKEIDEKKFVGSPIPFVFVTGTTSTQYVLMAFDGSKSIQSWEDILNFSDEMKKNGSPVHFSFFINPVYLLSETTKNEYLSPMGIVAGSAIGFSDSAEDISQRVVEINRALREGHEIGSHSAGHNDGSNWTLAEWTHEFDAFDYIVSNIQKLNPGITLKEPLNITPKDIVGFRAPNLGVNDNMYKLLQGRKFLYDSSQIAKPGSFPFKDAEGLWHIPLGVARSYTGGYILAMDYNWWVYQSGARDTLYKGTQSWEYRKNEVVNAYKKYFDDSYKGNKAPISIGHHFSMWNDGLYWEALKEFAKYACTKSDVKCVSHKEYVEAMEAK